MKRIALLLAALLMFSLTGCGSSEAAGEASRRSPSSTTASGETRNMRSLTPAK